MFGKISNLAHSSVKIYDPIEIGIVGDGDSARKWCILFAAEGFSVKYFVPPGVSTAQAELGAIERELRRLDLLKQLTASVSFHMQSIRVVHSLDEAVCFSLMVVECSEVRNLAAKQALLQAITQQRYCGNQLAICSFTTGYSYNLAELIGGLASHADQVVLIRPMMELNPRCTLVIQSHATQNVIKDRVENIMEKCGFNRQ